MTGRLTLALLVVIPAMMAYPWRSTFDWWLLGIAAALVIIVFARWRGAFVTTLLRRRIALLRSSEAPRHQVEHAETDARTTAVLRVHSDPGQELPLDILAGYLDRYGVRCDAVRVTRRDTAAGRATWVSLTLSAAVNMAALQARSPDLPLRETAEVTLRRLADHLRELGYPVATTDVDVPELVGPEARERWRAVSDGARGFLTCYAVPTDGGLDQTLDELRATVETEVWTAVELTGAPSQPDVTAVCAVRSEQAPATAPLPNLRPLRGRQRSILAALHPESSRLLTVRT